MFERSSRVVVGLIVALTGSVFVDRAHALVLDNPFGNDSVSVAIGWNGTQNVVSVKKLSTGECWGRSIPNEYFAFYSGAGNDTIWVVLSGTVSHCGWTLAPVHHP